MMANYLSNRLQRALTEFVYACQCEFVCILSQRGASSKGTGLMNQRKDSCEVIQKPLALQHIAHKAVNGKSLCAMRQWTRAPSQSRDREKPQGPTRPVEPCTAG